MDFELQCGTGVIDVCAGQVIEKNPAGFQLLTDELVSAANFFLNGLAQGMASELTFNQMRAINAGTCAINNFGNNFWNFFAAAYYAAKEFASPSQLGEINDKIDEYYPYVCTCNVEANKFSALLGGNMETAAVIGKCSEAAQQEALKQTQNNVINDAFNWYFAGGDAGPGWSNSTRPENSNMSLPFAEVEKIVEWAVNDQGWDWSRVNSTQLQETFNEWDMANNMMNGTAYRGFMKAVYNNQGDNLNGIDA